MKKIRVGNTISLTWTITKDGEAQSLEGLDLYLTITYPNRKNVPVAFSVSNNVISVTLQGYTLDLAGVYTLTLYENKEKSNQYVIDTDAFEMVWRSKEESDE